MKMATRDSYGSALAELSKVYDNLFVLDADLAEATKTKAFKTACPERFIDCGIAEGNMMSVAAGLATCNNIVFASSFAMFAAGRAFEQIRNSVCYPKLNVKIGATHAGISVGEDGATHQCCEDIALMRVLPNMTIINPCDDIEARLAVKAACETYGPMYLRFGRLAVEDVNAPDYEFKLGKGVLLREGTDVTIIATGLMVGEALKAYDILKEKGISARVVNIHTIKPIDKDIIIESAEKTGVIVTAEEHSVIGGLGSAVAEVLAETKPTKLLRVGVEDRFGMSGPAVELLKKFGLSAEGIVDKVLKALNK